MLRRILRKSRIANGIIKLLRRIKFLSNEQFRVYKNNSAERRIIYLSDIDHGNLGDHAIIYAMHKILADKEKEASAVFSFERKYCLAACDLIARYAKASDLIVIPGGGWIGTLWKESGDLFLKILEMFKDSQILVFPQTITFEDTAYGRTQEQRFYDAVSKCCNLELYVRDRNSYDYLINKMPAEGNGISYVLCPDTVLSLEVDITSEERCKEILFVLRKDKEKATDSRLFEKLESIYQKKGYRVAYTDTVLGYHVEPTHRFDELDKKFKEFAISSLVVTDRLHGMIFAVITNTPCIALDNSNHKVSGVFKEWLTEYECVRCLGSNCSETELVNACETLLTAGISNRYENKLMKHFEDLKNKISK